jgi:hypothetical protein
MMAGTDIEASYREEGRKQIAISLGDPNGVFLTMPASSTSL